MVDNNNNNNSIPMKILIPCILTFLTSIGTTFMNVVTTNSEKDMEALTEKIEEYSSKYDEDLKKLNTLVSSLNTEISDLEKKQGTFAVNTAKLEGTIKTLSFKIDTILLRIAEMAAEDKTLKDRIMDAYADFKKQYND